MNITTSVFNICKPRYCPDLDLLCFIPFFHLSVLWIGILFSFVDHKYYLMMITFFSQMLTVISSGLQHFFKEYRPFPECTSTLLSQYAFPSSEIVTVTSTATSILLYRLFKEKLSLSIELDQVKKKKNRLPKIVRLGIKLMNLFSALFFMFVYPFLTYCFYLCTFRQAALSALFGIVTTCICGILSMSIIHSKNRLI